MNTCAECLTAMSTAQASAMSPGSAIALHCYTCPECGRVAEEVRYAEYKLASGLSEAVPQLGGFELARIALQKSELARRTRIARSIRAALAIVGLGILGAAMEATLEDDPVKPEMIVETLALRCLSPKAASDLATPYLRSGGPAIYPSDNPGAITIRGRSGEVAAARAAIERFDAPDRCRLPIDVATPATAGGMPGKD